MLSIDDDARFVARLAAQFPTLPVVANQRCGVWYVQAPDALAYFKVRPPRRERFRPGALRAWL